MQPLYLEGTQPITVELEEGPALAITRQYESTRLLPIYLISHIVAHGERITWSQTALNACLSEDIPIFIINQEDHLHGVLRANTQNPAQDWLRFMRLIEDPDGLTYYKQFIKAKKSQIQQDVTQRWQPLPEIRMNGYYRVARIIRSAIHADIQAELHRRGFRRRLAILREAGIDLSKDLLRTLEPCVHWTINETWKRDIVNQRASATQSPPRRQILHAYETQAKFVKDTVQALILSFLYWLAEGDIDYLMTGERQ